MGGGYDLSEALRMFLLEFYMKDRNSLKRSAKLQLRYFSIIYALKANLKVRTTNILCINLILGNLCMKEKIVEKIILNVIFAKMEIQVWKDEKQRNLN